MKNFQRIAAGVDVTPLLHAIQRQPQLWNANKLRTTHPMSPHTQVSDIWLRFGDLAPYENSDVAALGTFIDENENIFYDAWAKLPQARAIIFDLMRRVEGVRLGRVIITKTPPGKGIPPHEDTGSPAEYYERYHVMLQNGPGSIFKCGDETVTMMPGEVFWFDNSIVHSVVNNSADDRITLIIDVRCAQ